MHSKKPKIDLIAILKGHKYKGLGPEEVAVYGALGCFEEKSPLQLYKEDKKKLSKKKFEIKKEKILQETSGRGHGSVLDQNRFTFVIENIPRLATLQLCLPQYLEHLQQSLRRAKADRGFYLPKSIEQSKHFKETVELLNKSFTLYEEMNKEGIPGEDTRYILPLYTRTNIQTTGNARELMHLHHMSRKDAMPTVTKETTEEMIRQLLKAAPKLFKERETNYEVLAWYPSSQLFTFKNKTLERIIKDYGRDDVNMLPTTNHDLYLNKEELEKAVKERDEVELANLKHVHYTFLVKMSLACFHQATRQRTWDQSVESIYHAIEKGEFVTPKSIEKHEKYSKEYEEMNKKMLNLYWKLFDDKVLPQDAIGVLPHSLAVYDLIHINGWNAIHSIGKRTCTEAQGEIRGIAKKMAQGIQANDPALGKYAQPQGVIYGRCPEKNPCGYCEKILKKLET